MTEAPAIYAALAEVMADADHVCKSDFNQHQRFNFRGIDAVVNAVGPALRRHRVLVVPDVESVDYATVQTTTGKPSTACRVVVAYRFYADDGSSISARVVGEAWDSGDKAAPKAMSVAFRTALIQALALPTDEPDPDSVTYQRADAPAPMTSSQQTHIAEMLSELDDAGTTDVKAWWHERNLPPLKRLTEAQAAEVVEHLETERANHPGDES